MDIRARLFDLQDTKYQAFEAKLVPNVDPARVIGVRMPDLRDNPLFIIPTSGLRAAHPRDGGNIEGCGHQKRV